MKFVIRGLFSAHRDRNHLRIQRKGNRIMAQKHGLYVGGVERMTHAWYEVRHKWSGDLISEVAEAAEDGIELAVQSARGALGQPLSVYQRYRVLDSAADRLGERRDEVAYTIAREAGKPLRDARAEVNRGQQTLLGIRHWPRVRYGARKCLCVGILGPRRG